MKQGQTWSTFRNECEVPHATTGGIDCEEVTATSSSGDEHPVVGICTDGKNVFWVFVDPLCLSSHFLVLRYIP